MAINGLAWLSTSQASMPPGLVTCWMFMAPAGVAASAAKKETAAASRNP